MFPSYFNELEFEVFNCEDVDNLVTVDIGLIKPAVRRVLTLKTGQDYTVCVL